MTTSSLFVSGLSRKCVQPRRLTTLWASTTACYMDIFTLFLCEVDWSDVSNRGENLSSDFTASYGIFYISFPAFVWRDRGKPRARSEKLISGQGFELGASRIKSRLATHWRATPDTNRFQTEGFQVRETLHFGPLGYDAVYCDWLLLMTRRNMLTLSPTSKSEATCFSETSLNIY
jgi:hypothetical protein